jgi:hypothetical protein
MRRLCVHVSSKGWSVLGVDEWLDRCQFGMAFLLRLLNGQTARVLLVQAWMQVHDFFILNALPISRGFSLIKTPLLIFSITLSSFLHLSALIVKHAFPLLS